MIIYTYTTIKTPRNENEVRKMPYLKPIRPNNVFNANGRSYWLCTVKHNSELIMSYPVYPRNKYYSGVYLGSPVKFNPMLWFNIVQTVNISTLLHNALIAYISDGLFRIRYVYGMLALAYLLKR